jgi:alpha-beta hydrolase superfamily lysophospholipase
LPIYIYSGAKDPVGGDTKGVKQVYDTMKNAGISDLTIKFYDDARHETLNEINRNEVTSDVIAWINKHIK